MSDVVGIRYVTAGSIDYCAPGEWQPGLGDYVVVEKDGGEQIGWVVMTPDQVISATIERPLRKIERLATADDVAAWRRQKERAEEDIGRAQEVAARTDSRVRVASLVFDLSGEHGEMTFTGRDNTSYAWLREDMCELLDSDVHVELVGDRDRAKSMGPGVMGVCGRELCCTSWMTSFPSVSIRMAKDQGLAPNPSKISGLCGRLLCCLSFEVDAYKELRGDLPKVGKRVTTPSGRAKVLSVDALAQKVRMRLDETGEVIEIPADELRQQYGTVVRPEELEGAIEEPARAEAAALAGATIAILEPVTVRPSTGERRQTGTDEGEAKEQPKRRRRRRSRSKSGDEGAASEQPERPATPRGQPQGRAWESPVRVESEETTTEEQTAKAGDPKRRRRGRRGGRRRRGRGGVEGGVEGGGEQGGSSGGESE